jgi:O-antigen ligase
MKKILLYLFCSTPILLITGPFLSGLAVSIIGIYGLYSLQFISEIKKNTLLKNFLILFFFFYIYLLLLSYTSIYPKESFKSSLFYFRFILFSLGSYFIISNTKEKAYKLIGYITICSFLVVFISLILEILIYNYGLNSSIQDQITGIFFSEKIAGSYISKLYPLGVGIIYFCNLRMMKLSKDNLLRIFFLISTISVFLSGERTSLAIFFISNIILLFGLDIYRQSIFNKKSIFLVLLSLIFFSIIADSVFKRIIYKSIYQLTENNQLNIFTKHHESHLKTSYKMFENNKIFGVGPRMFRFLCDDSKYEDIYLKTIEYNNNGLPKLIDGNMLYKEYNGCSTHPHNLFAQVLSESGLIGIVFYISFLCLIFFQLFKQFLKKNNFNNDRDFIMTFAILTSLSSIFFPLLPSNNFFSSYINVFYYFILTFYFIQKNETS